MSEQNQFEYNLYIETHNVIHNGGRYVFVEGVFYHHWNDDVLVIVKSTGNVVEYSREYDGGIMCVRKQEKI